MSGDVSGWLSDASYVVAGFFTPDYREMAASFAANLSAYAIPHMLYMWEPVTDWQTAVLAKPRVVQRAMED